MAIQTVLDGVAIGALREAVTDFLRRKEWAFRTERFVFYRDKQGNWKASGVKGCPLLRCTRQIRPGYQCEFWIQPGPHDDPAEHVDWMKRAKARGAIALRVDRIEELTDWFEKRWGWMSHPEAISRLARYCPPVDEEAAG